MAYKWTTLGRNFFEELIVDTSSGREIDTIVVGDGTRSPNVNDTALESTLYEADISSSNVTFDRGGGTGEIRATIQFTGGTEVPADSFISEFGIKATNGDLVYREVRDNTILTESGETKVVEIRLFIDDNNIESEQVITDVGREFVADKTLGLNTDELQYVAVGEGTGTVDATDQTLDVELYRGNKTEPNVELSTTTNAGVVRAEITVTAGTGQDDNVDPAAEISEFGLLTDAGVLLLHEKRSAKVILENNDTKTFSIPFSIVQ